MNKSIKTIILSFAITGIIAGSSAHAGLPSLIRRCFTTSLTTNDCAQGKMLKKLAEPYGLKCNYPVFVQPGVLGEAEARASFDDATQQIYDKKIIFNAQWVDEELKSGNEKNLIATLFHESAHLDLDHKAKKLKFFDEFTKKHEPIFIANIAAYAKDIKSKGMDINAVQKAIADYEEKFRRSFMTTLLNEMSRMKRIHEYEADSSFAHHADLCFAASADYRNVKSLSSDIAVLQKSFGETMSKPMLASLYQKACKQNAEAYETLEKDSTHPLNGRRAAYLLDMALKAPIRKSLPLHYAQWAHARADLALMLRVSNKLLRE